MSKSAKRAIGIVAAIAIPFAAPAIAGAIGLSGAIGSVFGTGALAATTGGVLGGALTGAALGGASARVLGGDVREGARMGALSGGVSGGISGYTGYTPPQELAAASAQNVAAVTGQAPGGLSNLPGMDTGFVPTSEGMTAGQFNLDAVAPGTWSADVAQTAAPSFFQYQPMTQSPGVAAASAPETIGSTLAKIPGEIYSRVTDPKIMADVTLRAAGQLAGSAVAGTGLSREEQQLLNAQTAELGKLRTENEGLFRQRLEQAQALLGEAKYFDPEYFGLQSARRAQVAGGAAKRAGLRGLQGPARAAEARRYDLATARNVGTAFDTGYGTGVQGRLSTMQAGLSAMPTGFPSTSSEFGALSAAYGNAADRRRQTQSDIGSLFGSLTGRNEARSVNDPEKELAAARSRT